MAEFIAALRDPGYPFLRYALAAGLLASFAFGILGTYVVVRRMTYIADAVAHCVLGGIGAAAYLRVACGWQWCGPMLGGMAAALAAALGIGLVSLYAREREDTVISLVWVSGVAVGLLLLMQAGASSADAMSYLFGDILLITGQDLALVAALDAVIVVLVLLFRNKLAAVCFDDEFSQLRGVGAKRYYLFLLCLTALAVVMLVRLVGILMVVALMTLPAAIAGRFSVRLWQMMALATLLCGMLVTIGMAVSYSYSLRTGPTIILLAVAAYVLAALAGRLLRRFLQRLSGPAA